MWEGDGPSRYIGFVLSFFVGGGVGILAMYDHSREMRHEITRIETKYDVRLEAIHKYIEEDSKKIILSGAAIRVAAVEDKTDRLEQHMKVLDEFRIEGGRYTAAQARQHAEELAKRFERLEDKLESLRESGSIIEFRLSKIENEKQ